MHAKPYTVAQLAAHWQVSDTFIYDEIRSGKLRAFRLGGKLWRIRHEDVEQYESRDGCADDADAASVPAASFDVRTAARLLRTSR